MTGQAPRTRRRRRASGDSLALWDQGTARERVHPLVLLVEDHRLVRLILAQYLDDLGFRVACAETPEMALRKYVAENLCIDAILADVTMPGMSGAELVQRLYDLGCRAGALCISASPRATLILERGLDPDLPILQKPFTPQLLAAKLEEVLRGSRALAPSTPRRQARRYRVADVPATCAYDDLVGEGMVEVLSLTGAFVAAPLRCPVGARVRLQLRPSRVPALGVAAEVCNTAANGLGVRFCHDATSTLELRRYVAQVAAD